MGKDMPLKPDDIPDEIWKQKAGAFIVRAAHQLWGKHNEAIMAIMFRLGFNNKFIKKNLFGWNMRKNTRSYLSWNIDKTESKKAYTSIKFTDEKFKIPPGLVIPYIVDKNLMKVYIVEYDETDIISFSPLPGSSSLPVFLCGANASDKPLFITDNPVDGFLIHQEAGEIINTLILDSLSIHHHGIKTIIQSSGKKLIPDYLEAEFINILSNDSFNADRIELNKKFLTKIYIEQNIDIKKIIKNLIE